MANSSPAKPGPAGKTTPKVTLEPANGRVRAVLRGETIAESDRAIVLREGKYPPRFYFPMADVRMNLLRPTTLSTHCPHKGDASYWTVTVGDEPVENAAWAYLRPLPGFGVDAIKNHLSFVDPVQTET